MFNIDSVLLLLLRTFCFNMIFFLSRVGFVRFALRAVAPGPDEWWCRYLGLMKSGTQSRHSFSFIIMTMCSFFANRS